MRRRHLAAWLLALATLGGAGSASAHPHIYVVYSVVLPLAAEGVTRVGFVFTFDELFSAIILRDAGQGEPARVARNHARILDEIPHEIELTFNGTAVAFDAPTEVEATLAAGRLSYRFAVRLRTTLPPAGTLDISVDDPGFYTAFTLRDGAPVEVRAAAGLTAACERARAPSGAPGPLRCRYAPAS